MEIMCLGRNADMLIWNYSDRMKRTKDCYVTVISTYLEKIHTNIHPQIW